MIRACPEPSGGDGRGVIFVDYFYQTTYIKIDAQLLFDLIKKDGAFQRFLITLHSMVENGGTLKDIKRELQTDRWWARLKLVYSEVKGLLSFSVSAKVD